jgi:hypothetical protein
MRQPPDSRKAPGLNRGLDRSAGKLREDQYTPEAQRHQEKPLYTASPTGRYWRVKVMSPDGETCLLGKFDSRLPALGAALIMSAQGGGVVVP